MYRGKKTSLTNDTYYFPQTRSIWWWFYFPFLIICGLSVGYAALVENYLKDNKEFDTFFASEVIIIWSLGIGILSLIGIYNEHKRIERVSAVSVEYNKLLVHMGMRFPKANSNSEARKSNFEFLFILFLSYIMFYHHCLNHFENKFTLYDDIIYAIKNKFIPVKEMHRVNQLREMLKSKKESRTVIENAIMIYISSLLMQLRAANNIDATTEHVINTCLLNIQGLMTTTKLIDVKYSFLNNMFIVLIGWAYFVTLPFLLLPSSGSYLLVTYPMIVFAVGYVFLYRCVLFNVFSYPKDTIIDPLYDQMLEVSIAFDSCIKEINPISNLDHYSVHPDMIYGTIMNSMLNGDK